MLMGLVMRFVGVLMVKSCEGFFNVARHAEMDVPSFVVPIKGQAKVPGAFPVRVTGVILLDNFKEVFNFVLVDVLYPEVVNDKDKADGAPCMGPIAGGQLALGVTGDTKSLLKEFLHDDPA
jgi:hypothetical protein